MSVNPCVVTGKEGREGREGREGKGRERGFDPFFVFIFFLLSIQHLVFVLSYFGTVLVQVALRERVPFGTGAYR